MAIRKTKSGIGIEFTGDRINLVKLTKTSEGVFLDKARSVKFSPGKKEDDKKILISNVIKAFEGIDFLKDEISLGVGGHMSFVRKVKLPPVSKSKLKQVVSFEIQQQVPFSLNEVIWDYQVISPISKIPGPVVVLIAAIKQNLVEDLLKVLQGSIKSIPDSVNISSLSLHNCLIFNDLLPKDKVGILVSLEFNYTDVSIENKGEMAFTRAVPIGKKNILKKIADSRGVGMEQAEQILESEDVSSIIQPVWEDLITEIKRTTNYYLSQIEKVTHFQYVYLSGEFPKKANLTGLLKNSFKIEVEEINPWKKIGHAPDQLTDDVGNLCISTGLALRALEHFPVEINLLPSRILSKRKLANKRLYFISSFVVLFLIGLILLVLGTRSYNLINEEIKMVEPILKNYKPYVAKVEALKSERQAITGKFQNIEEILKRKSRLSDILLEISKLTPSSIYITEISTKVISTSSVSGANEVASPGARTSNRRVPTIRNTGGGEGSPDITGMPPSSQGMATRVAQPQMAGVQNTTSEGKISLSGITASYPTVDEYIKQLRTSTLFKTVELVSVLSVLEGEQGSQGITQTSRTGSRGRTFNSGMTGRNMSVGNEGEKTIQKENVQFTLEIVLVK